MIPRVIVTDKLKSYSAAKAENMPGVEHCQQKGGNATDYFAPAEYEARYRAQLKQAA